MPPASPVFVAIDRSDLPGALALTRRLAGIVGGVKLGLEFWAAHGPSGVRDVAASGLPIFLDLKLHDIPNTVAGALRAATALTPTIVTLHAMGGTAMLAAAAAAVADLPGRPKLLAVTVLTSMDEADLTEIGIAAATQDSTVRLARLARRSGIDGVVCSGLEIAAVRAACGRDCLIAVPGLRPAGTATADQKRVVTPDEALGAGADILVVGRPITAAADPAAAALALLPKARAA